MTLCLYSSCAFEKSVFSCFVSVSEKVITLASFIHFTNPVSFFSICMRLRKDLLASQGAVYMTVKFRLIVFRSGALSRTVSSKCVCLSGGQKIPSGGQETFEKYQHHPLNRVTFTRCPPDNARPFDSSRVLGRVCVIGAILQRRCLECPWSHLIVRF